MMQIGMKMQITPFLKYQRLFNFGSRTGIDLPNESTGVLYDRDSMHEVELATNTFGQTFTSTMIQEYAAFNAVVNGGYYYEPHMVKQILDDNGGVVKNINPVLLRQPVSTKNADFVLSAMEQTVLDGTGKKQECRATAWQVKQVLQRRSIRRPEHVGKENIWYLSSDVHRWMIRSLQCMLLSMSQTLKIRKLVVTL